MVFFDPRNQKVRFTHSLANLLRGALEFNLLSNLLGETGNEIFSRLARDAEIAREEKVKVVLSSGSTVPEMVRTPLQIAAVGSTIGLSEEQSLLGVSNIPLEMIVRNSRRRSRNFIEEGVRVVVSAAA